MRISPRPVKQALWGPRIGGLAKSKAIFSVYSLAVIFASLLLLPKVVMAHILVADTTRTTGTILHTTPEDYPEAGATMGIYYEVDSKTNLDRANVSLLISSDTGGIQQDAPVVVKGQTVSSAFNFPVRGLYYLELSVITSSQKTIVFESSQQITRSVSGIDPISVSPNWAKSGLLTTVWAIMLLVIIATKRRKLIVKHSRQ